MIHIEVSKKIVEARRNGLKVVELSKAYGVSEFAINRLFFGAVNGERLLLLGLWGF